VTVADQERPARVLATDTLYAAVSEWLIEEAEMLDQGRFEDWLACLAPDVEYSMPVRESVSRADGDGVAADYSHFDENYASMSARVKRLATDSAWAESPPSRARRFVTNLRVRPQDGGEVGVSSYLLVLRSRGDSPSYEILSCERRDVLRPDGPGFQLARREIIVDQATLGVVNLALFF
jgi:PAH dioxygenase small subunit